MVSFVCPSCKQNLTVEDEFAGKHDACPHCKKAMVVPVSPVANASPGSPIPVANTSPSAPDLVMQLLEKDPTQRPASAHAVGEMVGEATVMQPSTKVAVRKGAGFLPSMVQAGVAFVWSLRPWASRRPGLAISVVGAALALLLLIQASRVPEASRQRPEKASHQEHEPGFTNTLDMKFLYIPPGTFTMGTSPEEIERLIGLYKDYADYVSAEGPEHEVEITHGYYMGATEVTVGQFRQFVEEAKYNVGDDLWKKPGRENTDNHPVVYVDWKNASDFCLWLSKKEGKMYRLPTEAEWEYSCRAGTKSRYSFGDNEGELSKYAWMSTNSQAKAQPVKELDPNPWGLHDMHGNVWEWCQDVYDPNYYKTSPVKDPPGPGAGGERVFRGGSWHSGALHCRSACRPHLDPGYRFDLLGFRVLLVSSPGDVRP